VTNLRRNTTRWAAILEHCAFAWMKKGERGAP
jgi:hypothetical protein